MVPAEPLRTGSALWASQEVFAKGLPWEETGEQMVPSWKPLCRGIYLETSAMPICVCEREQENTRIVLGTLKPLLVRRLVSS